MVSKKWAVGILEDHRGIRDEMAFRAIRDALKDVPRWSFLYEGHQYDEACSSSIDDQEKRMASKRKIGDIEESDLA